MIVLSLFDGMSCGRLALERAGVKVDRYYASEINKSAVFVASANFPDNQNMGSILNWKDWDIDFGSVDLVLGGSPCQGFSIAGKKAGFDDERSNLFFVYCDILSEVLSKNEHARFLLENVRMKKEWVEVISDSLKVSPTEINSALLSAQSRKRLYWANWNFPAPKDKEKVFSDISEDDWKCTDEKIGKPKRTAVIGSGSQGQRIYSQAGKSPCLLCNPAGGNKPIYFGDANNYRRMSILEAERLQTLPDGYTDGVSDTERWRMIGNGWTVDVVSHILSYLPARQTATTFE